MKRTTLTFLLIATLLTPAVAQIQESGNLFTTVSDIITDLPGSSGNDFTLPTIPEKQIWTNLLNELFDGNYSSAADTASLINYDLVEFLDNTTTPNKTYYLLRNNADKHWGTYVLNPDYCRTIVIQSPHPRFDFNTGKEGIHIFKETEAFFFCMSGTHRCNHSDYSSCSGTTTACGTTESFRISDPAHMTETIFQLTTNELLNRYDSTYFIQLHGFSKLTTDPFVILSNGTRVTPTTDYINDFKDNLSIADDVLTFKVAHFDEDWTRLIGFTNTQGRLINNSLNTCNSNATNSDGRFIHVEQEKDRLRATESGWNKVANALWNTFPCEVLPVEVEEVAETYYRIFPNPTTGTITLSSEYIDLQALEITNTLGEIVPYTFLSTGEESILLDISQLTAGFYFIRNGRNVEKIVKY